MQAIARRRAELINFHLITTFAARRAKIGAGQGERGPAAPARPAVELVEIVEVQPPLTPGGKRREVAVTAGGMQTARRRLPAVLARMTERDERRIAGDLYARAVERIGAMGGVSAEGIKTDGGPGSTDGGVTNRIKFARVISTAQLYLAAAGNALVPSRHGRGWTERRAITARELIDAVCIEGSDLKAVLVRAGWSGQRRDVAKLGAAVEELLDGLADQLIRGA